MHAVGAAPPSVTDGCCRTGGCSSSARLRLAGGARFMLLLLPPSSSCSTFSQALSHGDMRRSSPSSLTIAITSDLDNPGMLLVGCGWKGSGLFWMRTFLRNSSPPQAAHSCAAPRMVGGPIIASRESVYR